MQAVRTIETLFGTDASGDAGPRFEAGKHYPVTVASQWQVGLGNGALVDILGDARMAQAADAADMAAAARQAAGAAANLDAAAVRRRPRFARRR